MSKFIIAMTCVFLFCAVQGRSVTSSPAQSLDENDRNSCRMKHTPCGWEIYNPITRNRLHVVQNASCKCASDHKCVKAEDEISQSTYIYKCRPSFPSNLT